MGRNNQYDLKTLYDIRERAKDQAEEVYAKTKAAENAERQKLDFMREKLVEMTYQRKNMSEIYSESTEDGHLNVEDIQKNYLHIDKMKADEESFELEINGQENILAEAEKATKKSLNEMNEKEQEYKAIEKHKEKWLKAQKAIAQKKEEDIADDITQAKYFKKMNDPNAGGQS